MITLYDDETSADCHRVRMVLGLLGLGYRALALPEYVDPGDPEPPAHPVVLVDERVDPAAVLHDSLAALLYLCGRDDPDDALLGGADPARRARILDWLAWSERLAASAGAARRHEAFGEPADLEACHARAHALLRGMDRRLWFGEQVGEEFLAGGFSLADVACFSDVALSEEGGVDREDYPAVRRWVDRVKARPGLELMPGIFPAAPRRLA